MALTKSRKFQVNAQVLWYLEIIRVKKESEIPYENTIIKEL